MVLRTKNEKKGMVLGAVDVRAKPVWEGPDKVVPFRYSRHFLRAFKDFQVRGLYSCVTVKGQIVFGPIKY